MARIKKALITGSTATQVGSERTKLRLRSAADHLKSGLELLGYVVEHRPLTYGEDVGDFDVVLVGLSNPVGMGSTYLYACLELLERTPSAIIFVDDWQTHAYRPAFGNVVRHENFAAGNPRLNRRDAQAAMKDADRLTRFANHLYTEHWRHPVIVLTIGSGHNLEWLKLPATIKPLDPTSFNALHPVPYQPMKSRRKTWLWMSVMKEWEQLTAFAQRAQWPIYAYGPLPTPEEVPPMLHLTHCGMVAEPKLLQLYGSTTAFIVPDHHVISRTGWWRPRYAIACDARIVVSPPEQEVAFLGGASGPYGRATEIEKVEKMSLKQLEDLAAAQSIVYEKLTWPRDKALAEFKKILGGK